MQGCYLTALALPLLIAVGCNKYLDAKPDQKLATPSTLSDLQALMDGKSMTNNYPVAGDIASDDYYLLDADYQALSTPDFRNDYIYQGSGANDQDYQYMYGFILNSNVVLDQLGKINLASSSPADINNVKGQAYFFRAYCHFHTASVFALPFIGNTAKEGVPLKLTADITSPTSRSTIGEDYSQVISDLKNAAALLPSTAIVKTRPTKQAAFGVLSRVYLCMGDFVNASNYADSCLQIYNTLIDYNTVSTTSNTPFPLFNAEVIFHSTSSGRGSVVTVTKARIDSVLYGSYAANDLRKKVFFKASTNGSQLFKGDYAAATSSSLFGGVATDEMYLTRAECYARNNNIAAAVNDMNTLLVTRWVKNTYVPLTTNVSAGDLLNTILTERRKQLLFRNELRWNDIRRLNAEKTFAKTLVRKLSSGTYSLGPGSLLFAYLLPVSVVQMTGISQNPR